MTDMILKVLLILTVLIPDSVAETPIEVKINDISAVIGTDGIVLNCSYITDKEVYAVIFQAGTNETHDSFTDIATSSLLSTKLMTYGEYLFGSANISQVTVTTTNTVLIFNDLQCKHERSYRCLVSSRDDFFSNPAPINVRVLPSKPDNISVVHIPVESSVTTTDYIDYSSPSTVIQQKEHETVFSLQSTTSHNTTSHNYSAVQTPDYATTSSIPFNDELPSNIRYRTTTYSTQQTTTAPGIVEGDNVSIICAGDVGKPAAQYVFEKYLEGRKIPIQGTDFITSILKMSGNCSYYRTSKLTFQVTSEDNNAVIRCVVNSSMADPDMYLDTEPIVVYYKSTTPTTGSWLNKAKDNGTVIAIVVLIVIGLVVALIFLLYRRIKEKEEYNPVDRMESNKDQIESRETTKTVPSTSSIKKTTGYEDIDLDDTGMKFKPLSDEETIAKVKQHNEEYLKKQKEDEEREKDNPTQPPQTAVYACVNKPKCTVTTENKPPAGQQEEDVYEESKEGLYDTSGDRRHKENITVENYDSTEKFKNEGSDYNDLFSEQNSKIGANINTSYGNSEHKEEKRQVATVSPTVRMSCSSQGDGQKRKSDEIQPKTEKLTTQETFL